MNVLILGSGGREHVFATKIKKSPLCDNLFIAPGNAGTAALGTNLNVSPINFDEIKSVCLQHNIDFILPGNEDPLVAGITDFVKNDPELNHILIFGPSKNGAQLEGSKDFSKQFMAKHNIPTAKYLSVQLDSIQQGFDFLESLSAPYVLKADGLAAGKGVLIEPNLESAKIALRDMLNGKFGQASHTVVIEEFLNGIEMSCFVMTDGKDYLLLPEAKDYKRIGEKDTGLNTGGMGAISPVPFADNDFIEKVRTRIVEPTVKGFQQDGIEYTGFIFIGLMNDKGEPKVVEYNCRMGDPETEVVIHRIQNDLLEMLIEICKGNLNNIQLAIDPHHAVAVFLVSGGYPESFQKGYEITGLANIQDATVYQAGTKLEGDKILTNGGRVIAVTASGKGIHEALQKAMSESQKIQFENKYFRTDIGQDLIRYESI